MQGKQNGIDNCNVDADAVVDGAPLMLLPNDTDEDACIILLTRCLRLVCDVIVRIIF